MQLFSPNAAPRSLKNLTLLHSEQHHVACDYFNCIAIHTNAIIYQLLFITTLPNTDSVTDTRV